MDMDFSAIVAQLEADPGFRARLRAVVLSEELLGAPERLARLEARVAEMDARLTTHLDGLAARVAELAARVDALAAQVAELAVRVDALAAQVAELAAQVRSMATRLGAVEDSVGSLKGSHFEEQVASHPGRYLGWMLRRTRSRPLESFDLDALAPEEELRLVRVDAVVSGRPAGPTAAGGGDEEELLAAVEVSWKVHRDDLARAVDRAGLLARAAGSPVLPVAVSKIDPGEAVVDAAEELGVGLVVDDGEPPRTAGRVLAPVA